MLLKKIVGLVLKFFGYKAIKDPTHKKLKEFNINRRHKKNIIHFLHIGKNAGNQIKHIANDFNKHSKEVFIVSHPHHVKLKDIPSSDDYFFSLRDPVSRFVSGFYDQMNKPYDDETSNLTFNKFKTPNELAESLFNDSDLSGYIALKNIGHISHNQVDWFENYGDLYNKRAPLKVIFVESFEKDLNDLFKKIDESFTFNIYKDEKSNSNFYPEANLSDSAMKNLVNWYSLDFEFYKYCKQNNF
mgnify:FL=1